MNEQNNVSKVFGIDYLVRVSKSLYKLFFSIMSKCKHTCVRANPRKVYVPKIRPGTSLGHRWPKAGGQSCIIEDL